MPRHDLLPESRGPALAAFLLVCFTAAAGWGQAFEVTSAYRSVSLEDVVNATLEIVESTETGSFHEDVGPGAASQSSTPMGSVVVASLEHDYEVPEPGAPFGPAGHSIVESYLSLTLDVTEPAPYLLDLHLFRTEILGNLSGLPVTGDYQVLLSASLTGPGGEVFSHTWDDHVDCPPVSCNVDLSLSSSGDLEPGLYTLTARSYADLESGSYCMGIGCSVPGTYSAPSDGRVDLLFVVPEPDTGLSLAAGVTFLLAAGTTRDRRTAARQRGR